jgi:hypothetical protein
VVSTSEIKFNLIKTLNIIENNNELISLLLKKTPNLSFSLVKTMAHEGSIQSVVLKRAEDIFNQIILPNTKLLSKYQTAEEKIKEKKSKHFGKVRVLQEIEKAGQKTEVDSALLALNLLKNLNAKLRRRLVHDKFELNKIFISEDYRNIIASAETFEKNVRDMLKKRIK